MIWLSAALTTVVHHVTLLALGNELKRDWVLRWLRQSMMFVNLALSVVIGLFVLQATTKKLPSTLPVACVWGEFATSNDVPHDNVNPALSAAGTLIVMVMTLALFMAGLWSMHRRKQGSFILFKLVALGITTALGIALIIRIMQMSQAFGDPSKSVPLADDGESQWSYGQLLGVLGLLNPLITVVQLLRGWFCCNSVHFSPLLTLLQANFRPQSQKHNPMMTRVSLANRKRLLRSSKAILSGAKAASVPSRSRHRLEGPEVRNDIMTTLS
jgi:hypothetical protein